MTLGALGYYVMSIKKIYEKKLLFSIIFGIGGILIITLLSGLYRNFINLISLALL
ncbi:hypothetical protein AEQU2_00941 [Aequorivita lipolytica]|nr:hypothetical protein AEQU2_00941 [Aequorivita lipolytica]